MIEMQINSSRNTILRARNLRSAKRSRMGKVLRCKTSSSSRTNSTNRTSSSLWGSNSQSKQIALYEKVEKSANDIQKSVEDMLKIGKATYADDEAGAQAKQKDGEKLLSNVKDFVAYFNSVHGALEDLGSAAELAYKKSLDTTVSTNAQALKEIGITVSKNGELEIDEDVLESVDIEQVKAIFAEEDSFADKIGSKMQSIENSARNSVTVLDRLYGTTSTYNKYGTSNDYYNSSYYNDSYLNGNYYNGKYYGNNSNWYI